MKGIIIYKSKYGATECYAKWLSEKIHFDVVNVKNVIMADLDRYETIFFGSSVYIGRILLSKWIKKHWDYFTNKKKYLFVVGGTQQEDKSEISKIITTNFDENYLSEIEWFYMRGKTEIKKLNFKDKSLISFVSRFEKDEKAKNMLLNGFDNLDVNNLEEIINAIKE